MNPVTLNLSFRGKVMPDAEFPHPEGALLAKLLKAELARRGIKPGDIGNWKDSGWEIGCLAADAKVSLSFAKMENDLWFLQVAPTRVPGLFARLLGRKNSCTPREVHDLAAQVDAILKSYHGLGDFLWAWDAPPDEQTSHDSPPPPAN